MTLLEENRQLLDAFRRGDQDALEQVYRTYANDVLRLLKGGFSEKQTNSFVRGIAGSNERLDCLQDIFMKAFSPRARHSYDGIRPYRNLLMTIARNRLIDHWRSHSRDPVAGMGAVSESMLDTLQPEHPLGGNQQTVDDDVRLHWQRCLEASDEFVAQLDERSQQFVALRFCDELPLLEVARQMKMSRWRARAMEKRFQVNLQKHLQRRGLLS